jgi:2-methylcitrate dehydratase PrpD
VLKAMPKVRWTYDASFDGNTLEACRVEIVTTRGTRYSEECRVSLGHPDNPMTHEQQLAKFLDCSSAAATPVPRAKALQIAEAVATLDQTNDIQSLMRLLA